MILNLFWFCPAYISAQGNINFSHYNIDNGLSQGTVFDMAFDKDGFLWVGTQDGLNRYDGYEFINFQHNLNDTFSFPQPAVFSILPNRRGLWLGHNNHLAFFDLSNFRSKIELKTERNAYPIFDFERQKSLYFYTLDLGLCRYHYLKSKTEKLSEENNVKAFLRINEGFKFTDKYIYADSAIWIGMSPYGIARYDIETKKITRFSGLKTKAQFIILGTSPQGNICALSKDSLYKIDTRTGIQISSILPEAVIKTTTNKILEDGQGNIWLATYGNGLWQYNIRKNKYYPYSHDPKNPNTLAYDFLLNLEVDPYQNLWIGTNSKGMDKLSQIALSFGYLGTEKTSYFPALTSNFIRSIYVNEADSMIYIGSNDKGLDVINGKEKTVKNHQFPHRKDNDQEHALLSICKGKDDKIWLGTYGHGLFYYEKNKIYTVGFPGKTANYLPNIKKMVCLENGDLIMLSGASIWKISGLSLPQNNWEAERLDMVMEVNELFNENHITYITSNQDIYVLDFENGKANAERKYSVKSKILSILDYDDKTLVVGTNAGLYIIDKYTAKQEFLNEKNGLPNHTIYGVLKGNGNDIWFSTNKGLGKYNLKTKQVKTYNKHDGLQGNEFNSGAYFRTAKGTLCFGGMNGITFFNDLYVPDSKNTPSIGITQINIFDKKIDTDSNVNFLKRIDLGYHQNTISFSFSALDFSNSGRNTYQYKLEKIDTSWVNSGTVHFVRYAQLNPGKYTFMVRAKTDKGMWGATKKIEIEIHPPFWKQGWFRAIISIIIIGFIIIVVRFLSQRKLKKKLREIEIKEKLQTERSRIARELHDNVGSQLTYIIMNIEDIDKKLEESMEQSPIKNKLSKLSGFTRDTMQELREAIWTMNMETITLLELKERLELYMQRQFSHMEDLKWAMDWNINLDRKLLPQQSLNLVRIIQEATNNMLKYSQASVFSISVFEEKNNQIRIIIKDDGVGFDMSVKDKGFGLSNMKHRIQEIGGEFDLKSDKNMGTKIGLVFQVK